MDQRPPFLSPQINFMNRRQHAAASSPSLQQWFVQQLAQLKSDLVSNFDQINHKITAMDLSIRSIRDRVDRMDEKLDMTLIALGSTPEMDRDAWEQQWLNQGATSHDVEDQPPSLKRQRTMEMENCSVGDDDTQVLLWNCYPIKICYFREEMANGDRSTPIQLRVLRHEAFFQRLYATPRSQSFIARRQFHLRRVWTRSQWQEGAPTLIDLRQRRVSLLWRRERARGGGNPIWIWSFNTNQAAATR